MFFYCSIHLFNMSILLHMHIYDIITHNIHFYTFLKNAVSIIQFIFSCHYFSKYFTERDVLSVLDHCVWVIFHPKC